MSLAVHFGCFTSDPYNGSRPSIDGHYPVTHHISHYTLQGTWKTSRLCNAIRTLGYAHTCLQGARFG